MTKRYNLSADQQTQIKPILANQQQQMQALRQDSSLSREDRDGQDEEHSRGLEHQDPGDLERHAEAEVCQDQQRMQERMQERGGPAAHLQPSNEPALCTGEVRSGLAGAQRGLSKQIEHRLPLPAQRLRHCLIGELPGIRIHSFAHTWVGLDRGCGARAAPAAARKGKWHW